MVALHVYYGGNPFGGTESLLFPESFRGAEEMAEGTGELTGFLKEVQVEIGHGDVLLCGLHPLHLGLTGLLKAIL